jgi:hypothetical protein
MFTPYPFYDIFEAALSKIFPKIINFIINEGSECCIIRARGKKMIYQMNKHQEAKKRKYHDEED